MSLSERQLKIIAAYPLNDAVRSKLHPPTDPSRYVIVSLLGALLLSAAADYLGEDGCISTQLLEIRQNLRAGGLQLGLFSPLVNAVTNSSDREIWEAVIDIIEVVNSSIPQSSAIIPMNLATPFKASSARLGNSETLDIVELELFYEIKDCTHRDVPGFFERRFNSTIWNKGQNDMLQRVMRHHNGKGWTGFPADPWEQPVWEWLGSLENDAMANASYKLHCTRESTESKKSKGQMGISFRKPNHRNSRHSFTDVLVVGQHERSYDRFDFKACLLRLTQNVRDVFADQPLRRFVHAFTIRATTMELWIFDRSGPYSSGEFDIHEEPRKLACALVAYATMDDGLMGLGTFIELRNNRRYVMAKDTHGKEKQIELAENKLLTRRRAVVSRGTTCFDTESGVAKFSWTPTATQPSEARYLMLAETRGVEGVAKVMAHCEITSIAEMRRGLDFSERTRHNFHLAAHEQPSSSVSIKSKASNNNRSSRKRKYSEEDLGRLTRQGPNDQKSTLALTREGSKNEAKLSLCTPEQVAPYENRILSCLITSPMGRVLSGFQSVRELLEVLRDAIRAHQSLYMKGRILHRDISSNNIIIIDTKTPEEFKGMLIDLDLAEERDSGPSDARHQIGTKPFMAIEVLDGEEHTYRHDLESFFYVLVWMCARESWTKEKLSRGRKPPTESLLRVWEIGTCQEIARLKLGDMTPNGLRGIFDEFPPAFEVVKSLCMKIRTILFGEMALLATGTPAGDPNRLYNAIITAYDEAIRQL